MKLWNYYHDMAAIADKSGDPEKAEQYRKLAQAAGTDMDETADPRAAILNPSKGFIELVVTACGGNEKAREQVEAMYAEFRKKERHGFAEAIAAILAGERDEKQLIDPSAPDQGLVIHAILARLRGEDPYPAEGSGSAADETEEIAMSAFHARIALAAAYPVHAPEARAKAEPVVEKLEAIGGVELAAVIRRIWQGERDESSLTRGLDEQERQMVAVALHAIADYPFFQRLVQAMDTD